MLGALADGEDERLQADDDAVRAPSGEDMPCLISRAPQASDAHHACPSKTQAAGLPIRALSCEIDTQRRLLTSQISRSEATHSTFQIAKPRPKMSELTMSSREAAVLRRSSSGVERSVLRSR